VQRTSDVEVADAIETQFDHVAVRRLVTGHHELGHGSAGHRLTEQCARHNQERASSQTKTPLQPEG
jgi:hypothetical protein